jgi:hypothetical protein
MTPLLRDLGKPRIAPCLWASDAPMRLRDIAVVVVWVRGSGGRSAGPLTIDDRVYLRRTLTQELPNPDQG